MRLTRRQLMLGAGLTVVGTGSAGGAIEGGLLPGKVALDRLLGLGKVDGAVPAGRPTTVRYGTLTSQLGGQPVRWGMATPDGVSLRGLPVVLALHGRHSDERGVFVNLRADAFLADHVRRGGAPMAVVSLAGRAEYWHPRADGDDPLSVIAKDLLPLVGRRGLATDRIGVLGWSMGGFGALLMARESEHGRLGGLRVAAACASSPALFATAAASAPGAFDGPADWNRWGNLAANPGVLTTPLSVSCGTSDPFAKETRRYRENCRTTPSGGLSAGRHDDGYWRSQLPAQLDFLATNLTAGR